MRQLLRQQCVGAICALSLASACAQGVVSPNANLLADGIPPISQTIADKVAPYTEFRGYSFVGWHPLERSMLVRHREAGANIAQIYWLKAPQGKLEKLTNFPDNVASAAFAPRHGKYLVYARDTGGNEATQVFHMDLATRQSTLLSGTDERSSFTQAHQSDRLLIASVPLDKTAQGGTRVEVATTLTLVDPLKPEAKQRLVNLPGGGWGSFSFSRDDRTIAVQQHRPRHPTGKLCQS